MYSILEEEQKKDELLRAAVLSSMKHRENRVAGLDPFSTDPNYINLNTVSNRVVGSGYFNQPTFFSVFGRVNYGFRDK